MLDYWKIWISDKRQIETILTNSKIRKNFESNEDGVLLGITGRFENWKIQTLHSPDRLQITGSIHKYWNGGTNENDFSFQNAIKAIDRFCLDFRLNPSLTRIVNLEFGLNLQLSMDASEIIHQVVSYKGHEPKHSYRKTSERFFMEFELEEYYVKIYDKGKQFRKRLPDTPNTLRLEIKAMKNRMLRGIITLADLKRPDTLQELAVKFATFFKNFVFEDDTINPTNLPMKDRKLFRQLDSKRFWREAEGKSNSTLRKKITRFKTLVEKHGKRKIYSTLTDAINSKLQQLSGNKDFPFFTPNTYSVKTSPLRSCKSCGRDISNQHKNSLFCSSKYVGEREAKKCRNQDSNSRNNWKLKITRIKAKGILFEIEPYFIKSKSG